jgi:hypothetical protein
MSSSPKALLIVVALSFLFLAGCGNFSGYKDPNPEYQRFYQGTQGVMMRFQPGSPPPRVYYYAFDTDMDNSFNIGVELVNDGASDALGALYISGFSPEIIAVEGMSNQPLFMDDCILSMGTLGGIGGKLGGMLSCPNVQGAYLDGENMRVRVSDIAGALGMSSSVFEMVDFTMINGEWNLDVVWDSLSDTSVFIPYAAIGHDQVKFRSVTEYYEHLLKTSDRKTRFWFPFCGESEEAIAFAKKYGF